MAATISTRIWLRCVRPSSSHATLHRGDRTRLSCRGSSRHLPGANRSVLPSRASRSMPHSPSPLATGKPWSDSSATACALPSPRNASRETPTARSSTACAVRGRLRRVLPPPPPRREDPEVEETAPLAPPTSDARATPPLLHAKPAGGDGRPGLPHRSRRRRQDSPPPGTPDLPSPLDAGVLLGGPSAATNRWGRIRGSG